MTASAAMAAAAPTRGSLGDAPPFQLYLGGPQGNVAVVAPLAKDEAMRRAELTQRALAGSFAELHAAFAPVCVAGDNQLETLAEEQSAGLSEVGNNEADEAAEGVPMEASGGRMLTTNRRRMTITSVMARQREASAQNRPSDGEELSFDGENMTTSVRKLMRRISKYDDEMMKSCASIKANQASNQDEEELERTARIAKRKHVQTNAAKRQPHSFDSTPPLLVSPFSTPPGDSDLEQQRFRRHSNLLCSSDEEDGSVQIRLTASIRRLVIGLKDDSDRLVSYADQLRRRSSSSSSASIQNRRRRGNSCPVPYSPTTRSVVMDTPCPMLSANPQDVAHDVFSTPPHLAPLEMPPPPPRKKSTFARIAPKFLETLHLRKPSAHQKRKNAPTAYLFTDQELESIEGARWKIVELAFRFGGKHRFYLVQAVNMFFPLVKYGRRGGPHPTRIHCNHCGSLQWQHKRGNRLSDPVDLADVLQVVEGRHTAVFRKYESGNRLEASSFSLIFADRTLDLETHSEGHRDWLMSALRTLISYAKRQRHAEQQAIAEREILPLDDFVDCGMTPKTRTTRSITTGSALTSLPPANTTIRAV